MAEFTPIMDAVVKGKVNEIQTIVQNALDEGAEATEILDQGLVRGMDVVTQRWKEGQFFVPEVLRSAKTMQTGMNVLKPLLVHESVKPRATFAIGTVKGDLHDIGKNLVAMMLESVGYAVINLGVDVDPQAFVEQAEQGVTLIGMSALLTTTMPQMKVVIDALEEAGLRERCTIWAGGAPVTPEFATEIGADYHSVDAAQVIDQLDAIYPR